MATENTLTRPDCLNLYVPFKRQPRDPQTPNHWFVQRYPEAYERYGSPFLELSEPAPEFTTQIHTISINYDFFGGVLSGRTDLGHHVLYFEPEMQWYFKDSDGIYKTTTAEKLANQYRALMMKCAQDMPANVHKLNLAHDWRSDKVVKAVVNRAKSILAADSSFFCATSPRQRICGIEIHERLARKFVDELLTAEPGKILMLRDAYLAFSQLLKQRELEPVKRSDFKAMVAPYMKEEFSVALRNDLVVNGRSGQRGWKDVRLAQAVPA